MTRNLKATIIAITLFAALAVPVRLAAQDKAQEKSASHHHYKLIDMGTLGGPNSSVTEAAQVVNAGGRFAGGADTVTPDPNPCILCGPFITHAFQWENGVRTDLGALPGENSSFALWISNSGISVGYSENGDIDPLLFGGIRLAHAVMWKGGHITDLGTLGGGYESVAFSVNSHGQVAGVTSNLVPDPFGPLGTQNRTFLWENGVMTDLGTLGGPDAGLLGKDGTVEINERGQIVACSYTSSTPNPSGIPTIDPFLWENGKILDLGGFGGTNGCAIFLNNRGQVVGYSDLAGDTAFHPFLWDRDGLKDLGTLGGPNGSALWINEQGEVAGNAELDSPTGCANPNCVVHGFLWKEGVMTDLGVVPGTVDSGASSINSKTQIVGSSGISDVTTFHAYIWEKGSQADLNTLVSPQATLHLAQPSDINDRGEIAGFGFLPNGEERAFLLIPCDEAHPNIEGCDYSLVDADAAGEESPNVRTNNPNAQVNGAQKNLLRNRLARRFGLPGQRPVPQN
ncbi:MAG: hypothetical protein ACRD50_08615 [Candidatus Acidiferrales bacterium]